jgi:hypothetical protein
MNKRMAATLGTAAGLASPATIAGVALASVKGIDITSAPDGNDMVEGAVGVKGIDAGTIMQWIQNLTTFLLIVYVLLIVAAIVIGAIVIGTGGGDKSGGSGAGAPRSPQGGGGDKDHPLMTILSNIPFIGDVASAQISACGGELLTYVKNVLMETFKTTLVVVLAWVGVQLIIQIALLVASNSQSIVE